jgi:transcriptional regulator with XRE-family HTH domain
VATSQRHTDLSARIAIALREARLSKDQSLRAACQALDGRISPSTLLSYESGRAAVPAHILFRLADHYGISIASLEALGPQHGPRPVHPCLLLARIPAFHELCIEIARRPPKSRIGIITALLTFFRAINSARKGETDGYA